MSSVRSGELPLFNRQVTAKQRLVAAVVQHVLPVLLCDIQCRVWARYTWLANEFCSKAAARAHQEQ
jgi:hypothetical protein